MLSNEFILTQRIEYVSNINTFDFMDYAKIDHDKILNYIETKGGTCPVNDIREYSGADKLRVYPMLQRMEINKEIEVLERGWFGCPLTVRKLR